jgi:hypothetical protein
MPRGPKGEKRPADVIGNAVVRMARAAVRWGEREVARHATWCRERERERDREIGADRRSSVLMRRARVLDQLVSAPRCA